MENLEIQNLVRDNIQKFFASNLWNKLGEEISLKVNGVFVQYDVHKIHNRIYGQTHHQIMREISQKRKI